MSASLHQKLEAQRAKITGHHVFDRERLASGAAAAAASGEERELVGGDTCGSGCDMAAASPSMELLLPATVPPAVPPPPSATHLTWTAAPEPSLQAELPLSEDGPPMVPPLVAERPAVRPLPAGPSTAKGFEAYLLTVAGVLHLFLGIAWYPCCRRAALELLEAPAGAAEWPSELSAARSISCATLVPAPWDMALNGRYWAFWYHSFGFSLLLLGRGVWRGVDAAGLAALGLSGAVLAPRHAPFWLVFVRGLLGLQ